ncbi:hypothetical protein IKP13_02125, partial [bacterium]|nr:hypothetical protein [bacterium]
MREFFFLFLAFILVSCSGDAAKRLTPVAEEIPDEGVTENDDPEVQDSDPVGPAEETPDEAGGPAVDDNDPAGPADTDPVILPDSEPADDDPVETPDEYEDNDPETEDTEYPVCGDDFNGSDCSASYCKTAADCCNSDLCVATDACGGKKVCRSAFFKENFDSYTAGSFPPKSSGWTLKYRGAGPQYQIVTSERYFSAENSMHLLGSKNGNLSAIMTTALPEVPDVINVEMKMNTEGDDVSFSLCTFENEASGSNWGNYDMKVEFADGKIRYQIPEWYAYEIAPSYEANVWYKIRLKLDQLNKTVSVWVDDELKVNNQVHDFGSISIPNLCLVADKKQKKV